MALNCDTCLFFNQRNKNTAEFWCSECQEHYCDKCRTDHTKFQMLRQHKVIKIEEKNEGDLSQLNARGISFKTGILYDPVQDVKDTFRERGIGLKKDKKGTLNRRKSCSDLDHSSDEFVDNIYVNVPLESGRKANDPANGSEDSEYDYAYTDVATAVSVKTSQQLNDSIYVSSDQVGLSGEDQVRDEDAVLYDYSVDVQYSDLAKRIGIHGKKCLVRIHSNRIVILDDSNNCFEAFFKTIRRYGGKDKLFTIEFGRASKFGQGMLNLKSQKAKNIVQDLQKSMTSFSSSK